ncbi:aldo/keto reductase [Cognatishimia maritima]|uniref:Predicted oxidoreductase n=1 Tax=Cognatishimia maritima TaxID=870908 RepID=A0A1M5V910_9RHOB|nr:aldo/keto reductase [Cognatishimia maritima]SHH71749.1 Predicted oxidoreductase [Cognatishimia maritima]
MKLNKLGNTGIEVTELSLGTMTFGTQTSEADAHTQMDMAMDAGMFFWDTAEIYPVTPLTEATYGRTEEIIGTWYAKTGRRNETVIATKHVGTGFKYVRDGKPIIGETVRDAVEGSLKRLQTDCIDLYQLHWPNRGGYHFRQNWSYDPSGQDTDAVTDNMCEVLEALKAEVDRGTIRAVGLSNETAWGTLKWLRLAEEHGLPRMQSVQNEYSLLYRMYDTDMAEMTAHEGVGLLAYSPLATGILTGKYQNGAEPEGSRVTIGSGLGGRKTERAFEATQAYLDLAAKHGLHPVHMALAWAKRRPFMTSAIIGATTVDQLALIIEGQELVLSDEVNHAIDQINRQIPFPY